MSAPTAHPALVCPLCARGMSAHPWEDREKGYGGLSVAWCDGKAFWPGAGHAVRSLQVGSGAVVTPPPPLPTAADLDAAIASEDAAAQNLRDAVRKNAALMAMAKQITILAAKTVARSAFPAGTLAADVIAIALEEAAKA